MPKPRLVVHIGLPKAGSTFIQRAAKLCRRAMLREGIVFIDYRRRLDGITSAVTADAVSEDAKRDLHQTLGDLQRSHGSARCFFLSNEALCGNMSQGEGNAAIIADALHDVSAEFETEILVFLRRQDALLEAMYTQHVVGGGSMDFARFLADVPLDCLNYKVLLDTYADLFSVERIHVRRHERRFLATRGRLIEIVAEIIHSNALADVDPGALGKSNRGLTRQGLEVMRLTNMALRTDQERLVVARIMQDSNAKSHGDSYSYLSPAQRQSIMSKFEESNRAVAFSYLRPSEDSLFDTAIDDSWAEFPGLTPNDLAVVLMCSIANVKVRQYDDDQALYSVRLARIVEQRVARICTNRPWLENAARFLGRRFGILSEYER